MKKLILTLALPVMLFALAACTDRTEPEASPSAAVSATPSDAASASPSEGTPVPTIAGQASGGTAASTARPGATQDAPAAGSGIVGAWKMTSMSVAGTEYSIEDLQEEAGSLGGDFASMFNIQFTFNADGTGEIVMEGMDLEGEDTSFEWEEKNGKYVMTDSSGSVSEMEYDAETDKLTFNDASSGTGMVFERAE